MLAEAIHAGLHAVGRDTLDAGIAATPTTGVLVRWLQAAGGIQITASHNPSEYNGLKLFSAEGRVIPAGPAERSSTAIAAARSTGFRTTVWAASRPCADPALGPP